jgi:hypothetical protein
MLKKNYVKSRQVWKITFELPSEECPQDVEVQDVHLAGDFNEWDRNANPMTLRKGVYRATLELPPGREYQFRYLVNDEIWCNDWDADAYAHNFYGQDNCVVILPES